MTFLEKLNTSIKNLVQLAFTYPKESDQIPELGFEYNFTMNYPADVIEYRNWIEDRKDNETVTVWYREGKYNSVGLGSYVYGSNTLLDAVYTLKNSVNMLSLFQQEVHN